MSLKKILVLIFIILTVSLLSVGLNLISDTPPSQFSAAGHIQGMVLLGPTCPVVSDPPDPTCQDKPFQTKLILTSSDQAKILKEFESDENGKFFIEMPAGEYQISSQVAANILPYCSSNEIIKVLYDQTTLVTIFCDTGIR